MSHPLLFRDETLFHDPTAFKPERWLENRELEKFQFAFSKGSRGCPAINLAMVEMILPIVHIFSRYGSKGYSDPEDVGLLETFETDDSDIECSWDGGIAMAKHGSHGVRFRVMPNTKE
jgi:cytochrome P450